MAMLRLKRIFKNYNETGSLNEQINLYGFIGPHVFLTKSGEVGVILEVRGVDYECLDAASIDGFTKRLESALRSEEHTSELQSQSNLVCRLLLEKKKKDVDHPIDASTHSVSTANDVTVVSAVWTRPPP